MTAGPGSSVTTSGCAEILDASGGPPAANDIVLAAVAPEVEPSDFLGNLADRNDRLGADAPSPAAPAPGAVPAPVPGPNGTGPPAVILADGPPPATKDRRPRREGGKRSGRERGVTDHHRQRPDLRR